MCGEYRSQVGHALLTMVNFAGPEIELNYKESTLRIVRPAMQIELLPFAQVAILRHSTRTILRLIAPKTKGAKKSRRGSRIYKAGKERSLGSKRARRSLMNSSSLYSNTPCTHMDSFLRDSYSLAAHFMSSP